MARDDETPGRQRGRRFAARRPPGTAFTPNADISGGKIARATPDMNPLLWLRDQAAPEYQPVEPDRGGVGKKKTHTGARRAAISRRFRDNGTSADWSIK